LIDYEKPKIVVTQSMEYRDRHNMDTCGTGFILLTGGNVVISQKCGIPKIWEETLLLLLLGIDFVLRCVVDGTMGVQP
jgi:hypothetical protein